MALSDADKLRMRRHLGYPVIGQYTVGPAGQTLAQGTVGYRFFQAYGILEYRMNNMLPSEEAMVTGRAVGAVGVVGGNPVAGDVFSVTVSGATLTTPVQVTVTAEADDQPVGIATKLAYALLVNQDLQLAGFSSMAPYGQGPFAYNAVPLPQCSILNDYEFDISISFQSTGGCGLSRMSDGKFQPPYTDLTGNGSIYGWLPIMDGLLGAFGSSSQNLDTKRADKWESRGSEAAKRLSLYSQWQIMFSEAIGVPVNPDSNGQRDLKRSGSVRYA